MSVFDKLEQINKEHNDFLRSRQNYEIPEDDVFSDEIISEKIDDLKTTIAKPLKRHVKAIEKIADSAKTQSDIAVKTSKKADIKGWFAVIISAIALFIEFVVNYSEIISFLKSLFNY